MRYSYHIEKHYIERAGWLRAAVLGGKLRNYFSHQSGGGSCSVELSPCYLAPGSDHYLMCLLPKHLFII